MYHFTRVLHNFFLYSGIEPIVKSLIIHVDLSIENNMYGWNIVKKNLNNTYTMQNIESSYCTITCLFFFFTTSLISFQKEKFSLVLASAVVLIGAVNSVGIHMVSTFFQWTDRSKKKICFTREPPLFTCKP